MTCIPSPKNKNNLLNTRVSKVSREFEQMKDFCHASDMRGAFIFFGSARAMSPKAYDEAVQKVTTELNAIPVDDNSGARVRAEMNLKKLQSQEWVPAYWDKTRELAKLLTAWAMSAEGQHIGRHVRTNFPESTGGKQPLIVCTGGGPGFMEAANIGAEEAGGQSMGIGVVLPFETRLNDYVTQSLGHTCDTFFSRKYWEVFCAKAMVCSPGGVGTCDEMFEVLTLMQCMKMPKLPVVLLGVEFWNTAINFRYLADKGMMSHAEIDALCITDDPQVACDYIAGVLRKEADEVALALAKDEELP